MNEVVSLIVAPAAGLFLGGAFFGGLWWTVRKSVSSGQPALWFFGSLMLRMSITLVGFYFVGQENWERWLLCLLGFVIARLLVTWLTRSLGERPACSPQGAGYAP